MQGGALQEPGRNQAEKGWEKGFPEGAVAEAEADAVCHGYWQWAEGG